MLKYLQLTFNVFKTFLPVIYKNLLFCPLFLNSWKCRDKVCFHFICSWKTSLSEENGGIIRVLLQCFKEAMYFKSCNWTLTDLSSCICHLLWFILFLGPLSYSGGVGLHIWAFLTGTCMCFDTELTVWVCRPIVLNLDV